MVDAPERIWAYPSNVTGWNNPFCRTTPASQLVIEYIRADLAALSDAVAEREPYAYEFGRSNGDYTFSVYIERSLPPKTHPDWPVTPLYTSPPTSELEALRKRVAEIDAHRRKVLAENERLLNALIERDRRVAELEKAMEPFADIADLIDAETEGVSETDELELHFHDYLMASWPVAMFRTARRVREGGKVG